MTHSDFHGNALTTRSADAAAAFDRTLDGYAHFSRDIGERLKAVFAADPDMPMAHILRGYFFRLMGAARAATRAADSVPDILVLCKQATFREQGHAAALEAWCRDDLPEAVRLWDAILVDHPRDFVALKLAQYGHFYLGQSAEVRNAPGRCLHAWSEDDPLYASVQGMLAFGLEEAGDRAEAEAVGKRAVERDPDDPWSVHAVAHVFEMQDRAVEGVAWITGLQPNWNKANNFRYHLWWHRALMHVDLTDYDTALSLYDNDLFDPDSEEYLDICNDVSLLARLEMHGVDVGERWQALAQKSSGRIDERLMAFADVHFGMALATADPARAGDMLTAMRDSNDGRAGWTNRVTREISIPVCRAMIARQQGDPGMAVDLMMPVRHQLHLIGGSHAQRDLFAMLLIDSALQDKRWKTAVTLLSERALHKPKNLWTLKNYAAALEQAGNPVRAAEVSAELTGLLAGA